MFGTKKKQRSALPEKQQLTKYYEMDGALRAYANRMALLGMTCGVFALGTLALFAYVRLQPPVVIRVDLERHGSQQASHRRTSRASWTRTSRGASSRRDSRARSR